MPQIQLRRLDIRIKNSLPSTTLTAPTLTTHTISTYSPLPTRASQRRLPAITALGHFFDSIRANTFIPYPIVHAPDIPDHAIAAHGITPDMPIPIPLSNTPAPPHSPTSSAINSYLCSGTRTAHISPSQSKHALPTRRRSMNIVLHDKSPLPPIGVSQTSLPEDGGRGRCTCAQGEW